MIKLSICIPTYNRANYLRTCLQHLEYQVKNDNLEIIVIDNASTDNTKQVVEEFSSKLNNLQYYRNDINLGYTGNQIKCYEYARGIYTAFLSDDDIYLDGLVNDILNVINTENHDFIALNYYSFLTDYNIINEKDFAPVENITFNRAYDILNYPSVGHWSGFIIKSEIAKFYLKFILNQNPNYNFEKYRGIIGALMHLSLSKSKGTSFFYGKQLLAVRVPDNIDYNILEHLYLDNIKTFNKYYLDGIIIESDYRYRQKLVLENLTKAILLTSIYCNDSKMRSYEKEFDLIFNQNLKYKYFHKFIFAICRMKIIKFLVKYMYILKKKLQNE
jgi:glycosyltransferase involved in cell wall biosynthesis